MWIKKNTIYNVLNLRNEELAINDSTNVKITANIKVNICKFTKIHVLKLCMYIIHEPVI